MTSVTPTTHRIAVVGGGPRAVMVLERLLAHLQARDPQQICAPLCIDVIDPFPAGPGRVWRTDQSELYLMNTPSFFPTAAAADNPGLRPSTAALSFDQWRRVNPERSLHVGRNQYPARAVYGRYLRDLFDAVVETLRARPEVDAVHEHRAEVTAVHPQPDGTFTLDLATSPSAPDDAAHHGSDASGPDASGPDASGPDAAPRTLTADAVVLALGHQQARPSAVQRRLAATAAASHGAAHYQGPQIPSDVDWDGIEPGAHVLVRGMGLNAFDIMAQLTQGRGGTFHRTGEGPGEALSYTPSGEEPVLHLMSRRGIPYLPKAELVSFVPHGTALSYLSDHAAAQLIERHGELDLAEHVWPLLHRDVVRHYYATMARTQPEFLGGPVAARRFLGELVGLLEDAGRGAPVTARHAQTLLERYAPDRHFLDILAYADPFRDDVFASPQDYHEQVATLMEQACAEAVMGEDSPFMMALGALHAGRLRIKRWVAEGRISAASRARDVQGWFEPLVEGLTSGPPRWRVEQMLALHRAGLVDWVGRGPIVEPNATSSGFTAHSPQVGDPDGRGPAAVTGSWLIEAMMPANRVQVGSAPLMRQLHHDGVATVARFEDAEGVVQESAGFAVTGRPHRLVDEAGTPREGLYVIGLQLSAVQWGTAIAAEAGERPDGRALSLGDADAIATALLRPAQAC